MEKTSNEETLKVLGVCSSSESTSIYCDYLFSYLLFIIQRFFICDYEQK